jgi:methionine-rich copper-binding protein CopC
MAAGPQTLVPRLSDGYTSSRMQRILAWAIAAALAVVGVTTALAHAEPAKVTPGDGAVLAKAPSEVVFRMSQDMARQAGANDIDVLDSTGKEVTTVAAVIDNSDRRKLSVPLPSTLPTGRYTVNWKTLSADDSDAANGSVSFTIDPAATPNAGKVTLREDLLGGPTPAVEEVQGPNLGGSTNASWILVVAVGVGAFVLGAGGTFLLVQKQP